MSLTRRMRRARQRASQVRDILTARRRAAPTSITEPLAPWVTAEDYDRIHGPEEHDRMHTAICFNTGQLWVRPIVGRYRGLPRRELKARRRELLDLIHSLGGQAQAQPDQPLWDQVEYLENILDFDATMPCGCADSATLAMAEA